MKCNKCGASIPDGSRFCGTCGAQQPVTPPSGEPNPTHQPSNPVPNPRPTPAPQPSGNGMGMVLKILGFVGVVLFGIMAIWSLFNTLGTLRYTFYYPPAVIVLNLIRWFLARLIRTVGYALMAVVCLSFGLRKDDEHNDSLLLGLCAGGVLLIAASLVTLIFSVIAIPFTGAYGFLYLFKAILYALLWAVIPAAVVYGVLYAMGTPPFQGLSGDQIKAKFGEIVPAVKAAFGKASEVVQNVQNATVDVHTSVENGQVNFQASVQTNRAQAQTQAQTQTQTQTTEQPASGGAVPPPVPDSFVTLKADRSLVVFILLSIITCGIYGYYFIYTMARDVNIACEGDGQNTGGLLVFILLNLITCGFYSWYWYYSLGNRLAQSAPRYGMNFTENGTTILLWLLLGFLLCGIGTFVAMHILIKNTNSICGAYNARALRG